MISKNWVVLLILVLFCAVCDDAVAGTTQRVKFGDTMRDNQGYPSPQGFLDPTIKVCNPYGAGCKNLRNGECKYIFPTQVYAYYEDQNVLQRDGEMYPVPHLCVDKVFTCDPVIIKAMVGTAVAVGMVGASLAASAFLGPTVGVIGIMAAAGASAAVAMAVPGDIEDYSMGRLACTEIPKGVGPPPFCHNFSRMPVIRIVPVQQKSFPDDPEGRILSSAFAPRLKIVLDNNYKECSDGSKVSKKGLCPLTCKNDEIGTKRKLYSWSCPEGSQMNPDGNGCMSVDENGNVENVSLSAACPGNFVVDMDTTFAFSDSLRGVMADDASEIMDVPMDGSKGEYEILGMKVITFINDGDICAEYLHPKLQYNIKQCYPYPKLEFPSIEWMGGTVNSPNLRMHFPISGGSFDLALGQEIEVVKDIKYRIVRPEVDASRDFVYNIMCDDDSIVSLDTGGRCPGSSDDNPEKGIVGAELKDSGDQSNVICVYSPQTLLGEYFLRRHGHRYYMRELSRGYNIKQPAAGVPNTLVIEDLKQEVLDKIQQLQGGEIALQLEGEDVIYQEKDTIMKLYHPSDVPEGFRAIGAINVGGVNYQIMQSKFVDKLGEAQILTDDESNNAYHGYSYYQPIDPMSGGMCLTYDTGTKDFVVYRDFVTPGDDSMILTGGAGGQCEFYAIEAWGGGASGMISDMLESAVIKEKHGESSTGSSGGYVKGIIKLEEDKLLKVSVGKGGDINNGISGGDTQVKLCDISGDNCGTVALAIGGKVFRQAGIGIAGNGADVYLKSFANWSELSKQTEDTVKARNILWKIQVEHNGAYNPYTTHEVQYGGNPALFMRGAEESSEISDRDIAEVLRRIFPNAKEGYMSIDNIPGSKEVMDHWKIVKNKSLDEIYKPEIDRYTRDGGQLPLDGEKCHWFWSDLPKQIKAYGINWWDLDRLWVDHQTELQEAKKAVIDLGGVLGPVEDILGYDDLFLASNVMYSETRIGSEGDYEKDGVPLIATSYLNADSPAAYLDPQYNPCLDPSHGTSRILSGFDNNLTPGYGGCVNRELALLANGTAGKVTVRCERWGNVSTTTSAP